MGGIGEEGRGRESGERDGEKNGVYIMIWSEN